MGLVRIKGIVIKVANSSENDKILTVLTAEKGKIKVFCKGAKKTKSAFLASTEFLSYSDLMLYEGSGDLYNLNSAETINVFYNLRTDLKKLTYASLIAQIIFDVSMEEEVAQKRLQLLLNTLYVIAETDKDLDFVISIFKIRLLGLLGYIPRLKTCVSCNKEVKNMGEEIYFSIKDNGIKCGECKKLDKGAIQISYTTYTSILYIITSDPKKTYSFEVPKEVINELNLVSQIFLNEKLEKEYKLSF